MNPQEWPQEPGWYWFKGTNRFERSCKKEPRLFTVEVRISGSANNRFRVYNRGGVYMEKSEGLEGAWEAIIPPSFKDDPS